MHKIWLNSRREDFGFGAEYYECDVTDIDTIRAAVDLFGRTSSANEVLLVPVDTFSLDRFGVFLQILENISVRGSVWFYGSSVYSSYPPTLRGRCMVENKPFDVKSERVQMFLEKHNATQFEEEFKYLSAYPLEFTWDMLKVRESFVTFMYNLEHGTRANFFTLFSHLAGLEQPCCVHLVYEWLKDTKENVLFSSKELGICSFLRGGDFEKLWFVFMSKDKGIEKRLFSFLIIYKMVKVLI